jgi:heat shock protein HslJ
MTNKLCRRSRDLLQRTDVERQCGFEPKVLSAANLIYDSADSASPGRALMKNAVSASFSFALLLGFVSMFAAQSSAQGGLAGTTWQLVRFQGSDDATLTPSDPSEYTVAFASGGSVSVRIDCNRGHGSWKSARPNQLEFSLLALTRAMCPAAPLNDRLAKDWQYVRSYTMKDGHLFLAPMADGGIYEFAPSSPGASADPISGLPATFVGNLPCADCPGIRYQINLAVGHTYSSRMTYAERNSSFDERGTWQIAGGGKTLVLVNSRGKQEKFALIDSSTLRQLDAEGHEIQSTLNYDLKRAPAFIALEPQAQKGATGSLENTEWKLVDLGNAPIHAASQLQEPYLLLDSQSHRVSGSGGCNRLMGSYQLSGNHLTFTQLAGTLMACEKGMDTEQAFNAVLAKTKRWKITGTNLIFLDADGHPLARFEPRKQE